MVDKNNPDVRFEEELGVHHSTEEINVDEASQNFGFQVETETVFKRLAEDIYRGREAGIREPLTNAVTSVIRATNEGYLDDEEEGIILIELHDRGNSQVLTLRDNGVGITKDEVDRVVTQIGKSTTRSATHLTGQFGMGFLATWMLAGGTDGGFVMHSNPRGVDEEPFKGIWDSNGFTVIDNNMDTVGGLGEDEYGVEFEIFVDQSIRKDELVEWIDRYCEWTRVPVLFRKFEEDGVVDEEYPPKNLMDKYEEIESEEGDSASDLGYSIVGNDEFRYYELEHNAFTAVCSNLVERRSGIRTGNSLDKCILMDVPIQKPWRRSDAPLKTLELRIHYETPMVVDGPHEGMFVVTDAENPDSLGNDYISRSELTTNDIVTPFPTGTRDMLQDDTGFIEWLNEKFYEMYYSDIASIIQRVDTLDEYCSLSDDEVRDFHNVMDEVSDAYTLSHQSISNIKSRTNTDFSTNFQSILSELQNSYVSVAPEGVSGVSRNENRDEKQLRDVVRDVYNTDSNVYMAHRITQESAEFVWASEANHYVVRVASKNQDKYKDSLGWKELSSLDFESDLEMDDSTRMKFTEDATQISDERVNVHIDSYSNTIATTAGELKETVSATETIGTGDNEYKLEKLIIFQRTGHNISDNEQMVSDNIGTVSVGKDVYEYLKDTENVWTADYALDYELTVPTSDGTVYTLTEESVDDEVVIHIVDEETANDFRDENVMSSVQNWLREEVDGTPDGAKYMPITPFEFQFGNVNITYWKHCTIQTQVNENMTRGVVPANSDVELYAKAVLDTETQATKALETVGANWTEGGKELLESLGHLD